MTFKSLKNVISECCNDVIFTFNGLQSGVTSRVENSIPTFQSWHGDKTKEYTSVDELMLDKFFGGKSIMDLIGQVEFTFA